MGGKQPSISSKFFSLMDTSHKWPRYLNNNTNAPKSHVHVKNPLSGNINTRLRMHKVLLFQFRHHLRKVNLVDPAPLQTGQERLRDPSSTRVFLNPLLSMCYEISALINRLTNIIKTNNLLFERFSVK